MFGLSSIRAINANADARYKADQRAKADKEASPAQQKLARVRKSLNGAAKGD